MFYSWGLTLTSRGLQLATRAVLERLAEFESTQLAGHGMTALPLVAGCVALGEGRYTGLGIRKERKTYLSGRRVEGALDRTQPVVVVDDSLSSGKALHDAILALESEGLTVEGAIALVGFRGRGGLEWATDRGYHISVLFDITDDLGMPLRPAAWQRPNSFRAPGHSPYPERLPPARLARLAAEHILRHRAVPSAPRQLDDEYDGRGGVFVSIRRRSDDHRLSREGFWHFDPEAFDAAADVVAATARTLSAAPSIRLADLRHLKFAVTFMGPLETIRPAQLDFARYAIVVRDVDGTRAGGALPNTQVFTSEIEQYRHARERNARLGAFEPHVLMRQEVHKAVEDGEAWPAYGAPEGAALAWTTDDTVGARLVEFVRGVLDASDPPPLGVSVIESGFEGAAVTLYGRGSLGVGFGWGNNDLAGLLRRATEQAATAKLRSTDVAIAVTILHERELLGVVTVERAATKVRRGLDALRADGQSGSATLLPGALVYNGWTKQRFVKETARRSGARTPAFTTFRTATWIHDHAYGVKRLISGFPECAVAASEEPEIAIRALAGFTMRNRSSSGVPLYYLEPVSGARRALGTGPRQLHALFGLDRAGELLGEDTWRDAAFLGYERYLAAYDPRPGGFCADTGGPLADAIAVAAMARPGNPFNDDRRLMTVADRLVAMMRGSGIISARPIRLDTAQDIDFLPGAVLAALAADADLLDRVPSNWWPRLLETQMRRFRALHHWGHLGWQLQGWAAIHRQHNDTDQASFVFEIADWALDHQLEVNGAFLEDLSPDEPSFNTGFIAEGIASAWATATLLGDNARAARYEASWHAANRFMSTLRIRPEDTFCFENRTAAVGGVRLTVSRADVRADSVSHWLNALVTGLEAQCPMPLAAPEATRFSSAFSPSCRLAQAD
jgi:orotate phosphoribosyltransferase/AMMECR1 domain-containing protein